MTSKVRPNSHSLAGPSQVWRGGVEGKKAEGKNGFSIRAQRQRRALLVLSCSEKNCHMGVNHSMRWRSRVAAEEKNR